MSVKQKNFISCVVYLHNEGEGLVPFLNGLKQIMEAHFERYEIICVDDASEDGSARTLQKYVSEAEKMKPVSLINMSYYQGIEAAMNAGRDLAVGDFVYEFDYAYMDYDPSLIYQVYEKVLEGYDVVAAAPEKYIPLSSRLFYRVYNWGNKTANKLQQERFRLVSRRAINRVGQMNAYIPYRKIMYVNCGLRMATISYENLSIGRRNRSDLEKGSRSALAFDSFIIFTNVLEKISMGLCAVFLLVMVIMAGNVVVSLFSEVKPVEGWMSTFGLMSFGFFGLFLLMTLILKYLSVILNLVFKKQRYVISGIDKLNKS